MGNLCTAPKSEFKEKVAINFSQTYKSVVFEAATGDIQLADVDAIVTRTDSQFSNNNSLGRVIIAEGGPGIQEEIDRIKEQFQNDIPAGTVIVTKAGNFKAQHIIHAVLPLIHENDEESFGNCVVQVLTKANENRVRSLAVPSFVVQSPHEITVEKAALSIVKNCVRYLDQVESTTIQTIKFINNNQAFVKSFKDSIIRVLGSVGLEKDDIKLEREDITNHTEQTETPAFVERERDEITFDRPVGHTEVSHKRAALPTEDVAEEVVETKVEEPVVVVESKQDEVPVVEAVQQEAAAVVEEKVQEEVPVATQVVEESKQEEVVETKPEETPVVEAVQQIEEKQPEEAPVTEVVEEKVQEEAPVTEVVEEIKQVEEVIENKQEEAPVVENTEPVVEEQAAVVEEKAPEEVAVPEVVEEKAQEEGTVTEVVEEIKPVEEVQPVEEPVVEEKKEEEVPAVAENTEEQKQEEVPEKKEEEGEGEAKADENVDKDGEGTPKADAAEEPQENQGQGQGKKKKGKGKKKN